MHVGGVEHDSGRLGAACSHQWLGAACSHQSVAPAPAGRRAGRTRPTHQSAPITREPSSLRLRRTLPTPRPLNTVSAWRPSQSSPASRRPWPCPFLSCDLSKCSAPLLCLPRREPAAAVPRPLLATTAAALHDFPCLCSSLPHPPSAMASLPPTEGRVPLHSPKVRRSSALYLQGAARRATSCALSPQVPAPHPRALPGQGANKRIRDATIERLRRLEGASHAQLGAAIRRCQREWDMERTLEFNASIAAGVGELAAALLLRAMKGSAVPLRGRLLLPARCPRTAAAPAPPLQASCSRCWATPGGPGSAPACWRSWRSTRCRGGAPPCRCSGRCGACAPVSGQGCCSAAWACMRRLQRKQRSTPTSGCPPTLRPSRRRGDWR